MAAPADAAAIACIYNEGIEDRLAIFETTRHTPEKIGAWLERKYPFVVCEDEAGRVVAWASAPPYGRRRAYSGIGVFSIYVARRHRGAGAGRMALSALLAEAHRLGYWKLVTLVFPENAASYALCRSLGFRKVGVYRRHARLDGVWRDVLILERLLGPAAESS